MPRIPTISNEEDMLLHWSERSTVGRTMLGVSGERITILSPGHRNEGRGPDFLNGVLLIDGIVKVGHIEMHMKESDWYAHGHHNDRRYDDVVLHVLAETVRGQRRLNIPTLVIEQLFSAHESDALFLRLGESGVDHGMLAQYSWSRFLRRGLEILRSEEQLRISERIERAFVRRLFDALGYSRNRSAMGELAEYILKEWNSVVFDPVDEFMRWLHAVSALPRGEWAELSEVILGIDCSVSNNNVSQRASCSWHFDERPMNSPARRVMAGGIFLQLIARRTLISRGFEIVRTERSAQSLRDFFTLRIGSTTLVGSSRSSEIVVNAFLPLALAAGIMMDDVRLIEGACAAYRHGVSLSSNTIVRDVERRFFDGKRLSGAFFQQGAIEFYQTYCTLHNQIIREGKVGWERSSFNQLSSISIDLHENYNYGNYIV